MSEGTGHDGTFLGYTKQSPRGTYHIAVKGKRKGTRVDSAHVTFDEYQIMPTFVDKTKHSHVENEVDENLFKTKPKAVAVPSKTDTSKVLETKVKKYLVQDLVDES